MSFVITPECLWGLIRSLEQGGEIDTETRRQLIQAMYDLSLYQLIEEKKSQRGRRVAVKTWLAAATTLRLVDDYHVKIKAAAWAAAPNVSMKEHDAIKRAYSKLRSGELTLGVKLHQNIVDEAAGRLKNLISKSAMKQIKTGNK